MTKQQKNKAFAEMLKEFPKAFGRVSFRERLMLRTAFTYVVEEVVAELEKENAELRNNGFTISAMTEQQLKVAIEKGEQLEKRIEELENQNKLLGERCNQLLKDKGDLTDKIADIKANCDLAIEGRDIKIKELEEENERLEGDLELWESGGCRATNLFECGVVKELKEQIEKMKKYIKACWVEENLNDYSSYITNTSDEFIDLVKELNAEVRNGR